MITMKQYILNLLLWLGIAMPAFADNIVTVSSAEGRPGDEVEVTVSLTNTDPVMAAEVVIPLSENLRYVAGSATLNAARANGHQLSAASVGGSLRLYVYGLGGNTLAGNEGTLATFRLRLGKHPERFALTPQVILSNAMGQALSATPRTGTVTILTPELTITTPQIDFGHIPIRSTYTKTLTLKNTGTDVLTVTGVTFDAPELSVSETAFTVAPGVTKNLTVTFAPTKYGDISQKATIVSDASNGKQTAAIIADPFSVNELHVSDATGISDSEVSLSLTMNNMEPIVAVQCTFTLPDGLHYVAGSVAPSTHAEGLSATATVEGQKLTIFLYSQSNVPIPEGDGEIATFRLLLDGRSGTYYLTPKDIVLGNARLENMVSASTRGMVRIQSPTIAANASLDMGSTAITDVVEQTYAIRNSGQAELEVTGITFLAEGFCIKEALPLTVAPGATQQITVCYTPTKEGLFRTTMNIYCNDPATRLKNVTLSGSIYEPNTVGLTGEWSCEKTAYVTHIDLENYTQLVAVQMDIHLPEGTSINVANALSNTSRLAGMTSYLAKTDDLTYRLVVYSLSNAVVQGNNGDILTLTFNVEDANAMDGKELRIDNIILSDITSKNYSSTDVATLVMEAPAEEPVLIGDVNADGKVTVADAVAVMNYYLHWTAASADDNKYDINRDGKITVADAVNVMNIYLTAQ